MPDPDQPLHRAAQVAADPGIQAIGVLLNTSALIERLLGGAIQHEAGISHSMFEVLLILAAEPDGTPMSRLSGGLVLTSGGATRLIDRMIEAGLVTRTPSPTDRRVQLVAMTDHGEQTLLTAAAAHTREARRLLRGALSEAEAAGMVDALDRLGRHARTELPPLG
ncbi:MarR family winged helix-turn-helix transcriptional regulator [Kitasatospora sp. GAS204B]|uniref:MarR family winged helix-turn-helix transcriptional regulator n=1 Tax=unclassified Kitasatospora TaxID=2633591 RepID=UPI002476A1B9|nr:MarR family transcriptional regulator [Kitasatospora sp. GAS204B]MDH6121132.1 DNA-binding MarR family transcriptional regulator [Kitasatospora sp. GAS204B]